MMTNIDEILELQTDEACYSVLDVETTGLSPTSNNIIEIGIIKIQNNVIIDQYSSLINPGRTIPMYITTITGLTDDDVYDAPFFEDIAYDISEFLSDSIVTGHNLQFDMSFIKRELRLAGIENFKPLQLCTLKVARRLFPQLRSRSLGNLAYHLNIKPIDAHRATGDAETTAKILEQMIQLLKNDFDINSVKQLIEFQYLPGTTLSKPKLSKKMNNDLISVPENPGIYYFLNSKSEPIYIGKAKSLRERIKSYLTDSTQKKSKKILLKASRIKTETTNSELTALLAEAEMIKAHKPKFNTLLKKYSSKYYLRFDVTKDFPKVSITHSFSYDGDDYFGLFISKRKAQKIVDIIDRTFSLRECDEREFNQKKGCFLSEIGRCTAPCLNGDKEIYNDELFKVYELLYGKHQTAVNRLLKKMKDFSDELKFEKAAEIKELLTLVLNQIHKSSLLQEPINRASVLVEVTGYNYVKDYILLLEGKVVIKKYLMNSEDIFDKSLDDYFEQVINYSHAATDEDLEKMKTILNWIINHRNHVRIFYLNDYSSKEALFKEVSQFRINKSESEISEFDIKSIINNI
ncbi:MAG: exonuclease domain-containing protein [Ignavibacteria bacterium]|nr:exonuclease domain-containing protein [Ignavibacteria bacterium]